jgi:hypothetical protein
MLEARGLHVFDNARGPFGMLERGVASGLREPTRRPIALPPAAPERR